ncbi:MAG: protein kinase [Phycisphaeraceae bacterium]|nr:MAG: protein kinase [Phycisphaeraceae bacterium]
MPPAEHAAADCPPASQLERFASGEADPSVADHVDQCPRCRSIIDEVRENNRFLERLSTDAAEGRALFEQPDLTVPGYEILGEIHRGAQGVVYRARQERTQRVVALKMLLQGAWATPKQRMRMEREAEIAASLRHANIVTIYDSIALAGGRHAIAMEYIEGAALDLAPWPGRATPAPGAEPVETRASFRAKLAAFRSICDAVHYAHQRGVIHRDLKPANILVDAASSPHVLDFGIAKLRDTRSPIPTKTGEFAGTLAYASPEQVLGHPDAVDVRSDVYALGVILYELLTGMHPYRIDGPVAEVVRNILQEPPVKPSLVAPLVDNDLETILLRALDKDKERRYPSAESLGEDIGRYLAGEPIGAKRDSAWYVLRRLAGRHRLGVTAAAVVLILVVASAVVTSVLLARVSSARAREAQATRGLADALSDATLERARLLGATVGNVPDAEDLAWGEFFSTGDHASPGETSASARREAAAWVLAEVYRRHPCLATFDAGFPVLASAWQAEGSSVLLVGAEGAWTSLDPASGTLGPGGRLPVGGPARVVAVSHRGGLAAFAVDDRIELYELGSGAPRAVLRGHRGPAISLAFSPDGSRLASGGLDARILLWDTTAGTLVADIDDPDWPVAALTFTSNGSRLASGEIALDDDPKVRLHVWDPRRDRESWFVSGGEAALLAPAESLRDLAPAIALSRAGDQMAAAVGGIGMIGRSSAGFERAMRLHATDRSTLAFSPDGSALAIITRGTGPIMLVDPYSGRTIRELAGHRESPALIEFSPDGSTLLSAGPDGIVKLWSLSGFAWPRLIPPRPVPTTSDELAAVRSRPTAARAVGRIPGGVAILEPSVGVIRVVAGENPTPRDTPTGSTGGGSPFLAASTLGPIATADQTPGHIAVRDASDGTVVRRIPLPDPSSWPWSGSFSPDGRRLACITDQGVLTVFEAEGASHSRVIPGVMRTPPAWVLKPGEPLARVAFIAADGRVLLWDAGEAEPTLLVNADRAARCVAAAGDRLVVGTERHEVVILEPDGRQRVLIGHGRPVTSIAVHPDRAWAATGERGPIARVWDLESGRTIAVVPTGAAEVFGLAWAGGAGVLVTAGGDWNSWHAAEWDVDAHLRHVAGNAAYQARRFQHPGADAAEAAAWVRNLAETAPR